MRRKRKIQRGVITTAMGITAVCLLVSCFLISLIDTDTVLAASEKTSTSMGVSTSGKSSKPAQAVGASSSGKSGEPAQATGVKKTTAPVSKKPGAIERTSGKGKEKLIFPDLIVEKLWLDTNCYLNFRLKNVGKGKIDPVQFRKGKVLVSQGKISMPLYDLRKIDPGGRLKRPKGMVEHKTEIQMSRLQLVQVTVDSTAVISESNNSNNVGRKTLGKCVSAKQTISPKPSKKGKRTALSKEKSKRLSKRDLGLGATDLGDRTASAPIRNTITISRPVAGAVFYIGDSFDVHYNNSLLTLAHSITFRLVKRDGGYSRDVKVLRRDLDPPRIGDFSVHLEREIPVGDDYYIVATQLGSSRPYESGTFSIRYRDESAVINVTSPHGGQKIPPGYAIPIQYSFRGTPTPTNVVIRVFNHSAPDRFSEELYSGPPQPMHRSLLMPESWPVADNYVVEVTGNEGSAGNSMMFSLYPFQLTLEIPNGGERFHTMTQTHWLSWRADPEIEFIRVHLVKGGVDMHSWVPHVAPGLHRGTSIALNPGADWHPAGTDYKIRVEGFVLGEGPDRETLVVSDESDAVFEIVDDWRPTPPAAICSERYPLVVRYPDRMPSGGYWQIGRSYGISWSVYDESVGTVNVMLVNSSTGELFGIRMGAPCRYESTVETYSTDIHGGSLDWTVPETLAPGRYSLRVELTDGSFHDDSDGLIGVRPWLTFTSPAEGETWSVGDSRTIEWESAGFSRDTVDVRLVKALGSGSRPYYIGEGIANSGSASWTVEDAGFIDGMWGSSDFRILIRIRDYIFYSDYFMIRR